MKKLILLLLLLSSAVANTRAQTRIIYVRFTDELVTAVVRICGYDFRGDHSFSIEDSLAYETIKQKVDSLVECTDSCKLPDVRRQIIVRNGESYDMVSFNSGLMEKNGKPVYFDKELYDIMDVFIRKVMQERGIPDMEEELWKMFYKRKKLKIR